MIQQPETNYQIQFESSLLRPTDQARDTRDPKQQEARPRAFLPRCWPNPAAHKPKLALHVGLTRAFLHHRQTCSNFKFNLPCYTASLNCSQRIWGSLGTSGSLSNLSNVAFFLASGKSFQLSSQQSRHQSPGIARSRFARLPF